MSRTLIVCFAAMVMIAARAEAGGGGRYVSPMTVSPGVGYGQGTPMYAAQAPYAGGGCGDCGGGCYSSCDPCCPGLIPTIVGGIHRVLTGVFCGHRFCDPGCVPGCGVTGMACDSCGCDSGFEGAYETPYEEMIVPDGSLKPPTPADPFKDDPEAGSPQARQYRLWNMPQPVKYRTSRQATGRVTVTSRSTPRTITVRRAEPLRSQASMPVPVNAKPIKSVIRTASGDSNDLDIPANPLRD